MRHRIPWLERRSDSVQEPLFERPIAEKRDEHECFMTLKLPLARGGRTVTTRSGRSSRQDMSRHGGTLRFQTWTDSSSQQGTRAADLQTLFKRCPGYGILMLAGVFAGLLNTLL